MLRIATLSLVLLASVSAYAASDQKSQQTTTPTTTTKTDVKGLTCGTKTKCSEMTSCDEAKFYLSKCDLGALDRDKDCIPCESLCKKK